MAHNPDRPIKVAMKKVCTLVFSLLAARAVALEFSVTFPESAHPGSFTGKVVVYLSSMRGEPRFGPFWFNPQPTYSEWIKSARPGDPMIIDGDAIGFPGALSFLPEGEYTVQAVIDLNLGGRSIGESPGNLYSLPQRLKFSGTDDRKINIVCDRKVEDPIFQDTEHVKAARLQSSLLSEHYKRATNLRAAVFLPASWKADATTKYPVIYSIPGFGGGFLDYSGSSDMRTTVRDGVEFIYVVLDPNCPTGHHVFADSANNGPWGAALTKEFIPYIEKKFRGIGKTNARFVTGHSSGGWSSLWLQVTYPEVFGACWSTSPDPVDFRDFQRINLYSPGVNMFVDDQGKPRPIARMGEKPTLFYQQFSNMERPIRGEQLGSFEAVFSPRGPGDVPLKLWDRITGVVSAEVANSWRKYDISLILRTKWKDLEPKLKGKIHVYMGNMDTFYLEGATKLLQTEMKSLGSDAVIELFPGDHGTVMTRDLLNRIDREMAEKYRAGLKGN